MAGAQEDTLVWKIDPNQAPGAFADQDVVHIGRGLRIWGIEPNGPHVISPRAIVALRQKSRAEGINLGIWAEQSELIWGHAGPYLVIAQGARE